MEEKDALKELESRVQYLLSVSKDEQYNRYLQELNNRILTEKGKINALYSEFNTNYSIYLSNQKKLEAKTAIHPNNNQCHIENKRLDENITTPKESTSMEFKIGAWLFGIIGALFILASFVIMGTTFMDGLFKGLTLYLISGFFLLLSEFIVARKMPKFSLCITGLGICSLYTSTIINYLYLKNFNGLVAIILTFVITGIAIFISRHKDSAVIKIISFLGCYICFYPIHGFAGDQNFVTIIFILLFVNVMTIFLPVKKGQFGVYLTHMISNMIFTAIIIHLGFNSDVTPALLLLESILSIFVQSIIFLIQVKEIQRKEKNKSAYKAANIYTYCITLFIQFFYFTGITEYETFLPGRAVVHIAFLIITIMALIIFFVQRKHQERWIHYWAWNLLAYMVYGIAGQNSAEIIGVLLTLFIISKVLSRVSILKVSEIIITFITLIFGIYYYFNTEFEGFLFAAVFLISVLALYYWKTLYEGLIIFMMCMFAIAYIPSENVVIPVCVGILLLGMLGFTNFRFFRGRCIVGYNICSLVAMSGFYFLMIFIKNPVTYFCMLIFGLTVLAVTLQKKYGLNVKGKPLIFSLFLTYMACVFHVSLPIMLSILLMLIAIGSVGIGFALKNKSQRIYGLMLSIFVCFKVLFFDFRGIEAIQRMILFLVVGIIIMAISGIYIFLEKRVSE